MKIYFSFQLQNHDGDIGIGNMEFWGTEEELSYIHANPYMAITVETEKHTHILGCQLKTIQKMAENSYHVVADINLVFDDQEQANAWINSIYTE